MVRVVLCGTHPSKFNGYSKVMFELSKRLCNYKDIELFIYGFQNFHKNSEHIMERSLPKNVQIFDAYENENPKNKGFGENTIIDYLLKINPDIIIIYNDILIINMLIKQIKKIKDIKFKIIPYIDIVYKNENQELLKNINNNCDGGIMFTDYWKNQMIHTNKFDKPLWVLEHGFNKSQYFKIPQFIARKYYNISEDTFVILNLNRNQPRKRWDICIIAYVKFISKHLDDNIKLMISTETKGSWNLLELIKNEAKKYGIIDKIQDKFTFIQLPQKMSDYDINVMYNVADVGLNTCDGEGFGLCNFEQAGIGIPQIVPYVGGFRDFFNDSNSLLIKPKFSLYSDNVVSGELEICDINDYVAALEMYYSDRELLRKHGAAAREQILKNYDWDQKSEKLHEIIQQVCCSNSVEDDCNNIDINDLIKEKMMNFKKSKIYTKSNRFETEDIAPETLETLQIINVPMFEKNDDNLLTTNDAIIEGILAKLT